MDAPVISSGDRPIQRASMCVSCPVHLPLYILPSPGWESHCPAGCWVNLIKS
jgi:hypothetical protein